MWLRIIHRIGSVFTGALLYADDIALLACSCFGLQKLINVCITYGIQWDISFNPVKSQIACFGVNLQIVKLCTLEAQLV